jgi:hypothetical protein
VWQKFAGDRVPGKSEGIILEYEREGEGERERERRTTYVTKDLLIPHSRRK